MYKYFVTLENKTLESIIELEVSREVFIDIWHRVPQTSNKEWTLEVMGTEMLVHACRIEKQKD